MASMQLHVTKPSKKGTKDYGEISVDSRATVGDLKKVFEKHSRLSRYRHGFKLVIDDNTLVSLVDDKETLTSYGVKSGSHLQFKDFGPQIGYRTVFIVEYLGPLLFVLLYAARPSFIYGHQASLQEFNSTAWLGVICWTIHFLKREFESIFVHRFSRPTMPFHQIFKNSAYYWSFGLVIGYPLCHPAYTPPASEFQIQLGLCIFAISEVLNFAVHVQLRNMRPAEGSLLRPIPKGPLFQFVSCPNYLFEVLGWIGFSLMTQILFSYMFTIVGFLQMADWALKKHRNYLKTYGDEYKKLGRKAIVPFIL